jgi:hypothetical protein
MHITRPGRITLPMGQRHLQVHVGGQVILIIIIHRIMRRPWVAYREGACLSPHGTSMTASMDRSCTVLLRTTTSLLYNIIINLCITIIIHHLQWAMMSPISTRTSTTTSCPLSQDRRRYATPFTNK